MDASGKNADMKRLGAVLLEVLIALAILGFVAASTLTFAAEGAARVRSNRVTEAELRGASALLDAVVLWSRGDLDRHLGRRRQGEWTMEVQRPAASLYEVSLEDRQTGRLLLHTSLYRPERQK
jgi:type II secretory pathway pseudopilin PulG